MTELADAGAGVTTTHHDRGTIAQAALYIHTAYDGDRATADELCAALGLPRRKPAAPATKCGFRLRYRNAVHQGTFLCARDLGHDGAHGRALIEP